jgi:23S rRNA pseudouridine955/2504/2580 synthase
MNTPIKISANDDGIRLERYIEKKFPQVPRAMRQKFFRIKKLAVFRNGKRQKLEKSFTLQTDDEVKIFFNPSEFGEKKENSKIRNFDSILKNPKLKKISFVYEDEYFFVAEKPAGVAVHPGSGIRFGHSLIDYCIAKILSKNPKAPEPKLVHRLDKDTSGLVLVAKSDSILRKLTQMLREGKIQKYYIALVQGRLKKKSGTITEKIARNEGSKYTKISIDNQQGKESVTHYTEKKFFPELNASLLEIKLETGRMHQIRIHFSSQGFPLAGDDVYGNFNWNKKLKKSFKLKRQFLHATKLEFSHPITGEKTIIKSELPEDLQKCLL